MEISKLNTDITTSSLMQRALEEYISSEKWKNNIKYLNTEYHERYSLMKNILDNDFNETLDYNDPKGGLTFYVKLKNESISIIKLFEELRKQDVYITPAEIFFISSKDGEYSFRIGFYQTDKEKIKKGMSILKSVLDNLKYNSN